jgi:hypothetical protein
MSMLGKISDRPTYTVLKKYAAPQWLAVGALFADYQKE